MYTCLIRSIIQHLYEDSMSDGRVCSCSFQIFRHVILEEYWHWSIGPLILESLKIPNICGNKNEKCNVGWLNLKIYPYSSTHPDLWAIGDPIEGGRSWWPRGSGCPQPWIFTSLKQACWRDRVRVCWMLTLPHAFFFNDPHLPVELVLTPPQNHGGVIFSLQFLCVSVCVSVIVSNGDIS